MLYARVYLKGIEVEEEKIVKRVVRLGEYKNKLYHENTCTVKNLEKEKCIGEI